jgi:hypothetical protein
MSLAVFSPVKSMLSARGARSRPSTMWTRPWIRPSPDALYELQDRLGEPIEVVEYEEPFDSGSLDHQVHVPVDRR